MPIGLAQTFTLSNDESYIEYQPVLFSLLMEVSGANSDLHNEYIRGPFVQMDVCSYSDSFSVTKRRCYNWAYSKKGEIFINIENDFLIELLKSNEEAYMEYALLKMRGKIR